MLFSDVNFNYCFHFKKIQVCTISSKTVGKNIFFNLEGYDNNIYVKHIF